MHLEEACASEDICHRYGKIRTPLDHLGSRNDFFDLTYFVNSNFWDPVAHPHAPIFINMGYGGTGQGWTAGRVRSVDDATFSRGFPGTTLEFARELGALIINVPNRYYGCESARLEDPAGSCPTSLDPIPSGEEGTIEAHERLRFLNLQNVVDDIAHVARETISTFAEDWGMQLAAGQNRAANQPIVFGCSWPGAAAVYARMRHPELFPGAVATSHPLVSSREGNNHYRSFVGAVYELYAAGGSLECRNVVTVGHEIIRRKIEDQGVDNGPVGSCVQDCIIAESVNRDFGLDVDRYYSFGGGIPGLPGVQSINRNCTALGCNIENTCAYILSCFHDKIPPSVTSFPISSDDDERVTDAAYRCLSEFSGAVRDSTRHKAKARDAARVPTTMIEEQQQMVYNPDSFIPAYDLGPIVYQSNTLTYQMFGFKGPLWMTQTCNDGSGCPFVQGKVGGASYEQINARLWSSYAKPGETLDEFTAMMREGADLFNLEFGGQRPWTAASSSASATNIYMVYNDADPWTGTGVFPHMPTDRNLTYDLGGGGIAHCVYPALGAQKSILEWIQVEAI